MSTAEVADVLMFLDCIKEAAVYGVQVPGNHQHFLKMALESIQHLLSYFASRQTNVSYHKKKKQNNPFLFLSYKASNVDLQIRRAEQEWQPSPSLMDTLTPSGSSGMWNSSCRRMRGRVLSGFRYGRVKSPPSQGH